MAYTTQTLLTFEAFLAQYGDNPRYELADGELVEMEPTGPDETVSGKLATQIGIAITLEKLPWFIPRTCLIRPFAEAATARRPDVVVLKEPIITLGRSIKLVVEVVSTNWETDYAQKVEEYALLRIPEYWIVDYWSLGGVAFIGKPKQPTVTICQLVDKDYTQQQFRLSQPIVSPQLKSLKICLDDILPR